MLVYVFTPRSLWLIYQDNIAHIYLLLHLGFWGGLLLTYSFWPAERTVNCVCRPLKTSVWKRLWLITSNLLNWRLLIVFEAIVFKHGFSSEYLSVWFVYWRLISSFSAEGENETGKPGGHRIFRFFRGCQGMLDVAARVNGDHTACAAACMYVYRRNATFRSYFLLHARASLSVR